MGRRHIPSRNEVCQSMPLMVIRKIVDEDLAKPVQTMTAIQIDRLLKDLGEMTSPTTQYLPGEPVGAKPG